MVVFLAVLVPVVVILLGFMVQVVGRICLSGEDIPAVALVCQDLQDGARRPDLIPPFCQPLEFSQGISDLLGGIAI